MNTKTNIDIYIMKFSFVKIYKKRIHSEDPLGFVVFDSSFSDERTSQKSC